MQEIQQDSNNHNNSNNSNNNNNIESMQSAMLLSATYDGNSKSAILKFYEPTSQKLILWKDEIDHKPYCYSKLAPEELEFLRENDGVLDIKTTQKYELMSDKQINISKIIAADPLTIGGTTG